MKERRSRFQLLLAKNLLVAMIYMAAVLVMADVVLSLYVFRSAMNITGNVVFGAVVGYFLHKQLASKYRKDLIRKEDTGAGSIE